MQQIPEVTCLLMAGGNSERMGQDKAMLPISGVPMIQHIHQQLTQVFRTFVISTNSPERYAFMGLPMVRDLRLDAGPLMGLYSVMQKCTDPAIFVCACDIPDIPVDHIMNMVDHLGTADAVVPVSGSEGHYEPLFAFYSVSCLSAIEQSILAGRNKTSSFFDSVSIFEYALDGNDLKNINHPDDYQNFLDRS